MTAPHGLGLARAWCRSGAPRSDSSPRRGCPLPSAVAPPVVRQLAGTVSATKVPVPARADTYP
ncbi:hypothetical protein LK538_25045, partial [Serratia marcescens]|uniref:hypothetical protein n=1 Tax=Serratia marcescens TaxID=615 RepID=UPI001D15B76F